MKKSILHIIADFLYLSPEGKLLDGNSAYLEWRANKYKTLTDVEKVNLFIDAIVKTYGKKGKEEFIEVPEKIRKTYKEGSFLDELFFLDYYNIKGIGLTRPALLLKLAKTHRDAAAIDLLIKDSIFDIYKLIKDKKVDAIAFVPASVKRDPQFMNKLKAEFADPAHPQLINRIKEGYPKRTHSQHMNFFKKKFPNLVSQIILSKITYDKIPVAQKDLNTIQERRDNVRKTFIVEEYKEEYKRILLVDDMVGSGATLNEIAKKLKDNDENIETIIGLGLVGDPKPNEFPRGDRGI